jgi:Ca2+-transporting ATPase
MTGDGVNDAAALKKSNIGVAVGSGTEVAKEASDFVLLDDSFSNIVGAVEQGRGIYDNIQKSIMLLLSGNLGEVLIIFLAVMFGFNLPLTAVLLLWINLITDGMPALAYSVDPYGKNIMKKRPRPKKEGILPEPKFWLIGFLGVIGTAIALTMFYIMGGNSSEQSMIRLAQTMVFNFVVLYELILVFIIRKDYDVPLFTNIWLWMAVFASIALQGLLMYTPLHRFFEITPLGFSELGYLVLSGIVFYMLSMLYYLTGHKLLKKRYEATNS